MKNCYIRMQRENERITSLETDGEYMTEKEAAAWLAANAPNGEIGANDGGANFRCEIVEDA